jgi:hypothetical protein
MAGSASIMNLFLIAHRVCVNFLKDIPFSPRAFRALYRRRRRMKSRKVNEVDRLDRIRNPSKYLGR